MRTGYEAIVIGAGALGAAVALELARAGRATLVLDRLGAAGHGSTSDSASIVRVFASNPAAVILSSESVAGWHDWRGYLGADDELGYAEYRRTGTLLVKSATGNHERALPHLRELGIPHEEWNAADLAERVPIFDVRSFWPPRRPDDERFWHEPERELEGAIHIPEGGYVTDASLAAHNLQRAAEAAGAEFLFRANVAEIPEANGRVVGVVLADGTRIEAPVVVNVAGPHSGAINRLAGVEEGMRMATTPLRHELHVVPAPAGFDYERDGFHVSDGDLGINFRPETGNRILVGTEDPPCDPQTWIDDPDDYDRNVTKERWEAQVYRLARRIPDLPIPLEPKGFAGVYDVTADWTPIYDRSDLDGFYMAVGTSGNQFKNAPTVGRLMAELIEACESGRDHDADPVRIHCPRVGRTLDLGAFSRLREASRDASLSVVG